MFIFYVSKCFQSKESQVDTRWPRLKVPPPTPWSALGPSLRMLADVHPDPAWEGDEQGDSFLWSTSIKPTPSLARNTCVQRNTWTFEVCGYTPAVKPPTEQFHRFPFSQLFPRVSFPSADDFFPFFHFRSGHVLGALLAICHVSGLKDVSPNRQHG
jgi:hypothetical protein